MSSICTIVEWGEVLCAAFSCCDACAGAIDVGDAIFPLGAALRGAARGAGEAVRQGAAARLSDRVAPLVLVELS